MYTNSTKFLLPFLKLNGKILQQLGFQNAYIDDSDKPKNYKNCLFIHIQPKDKEFIKKYITDLYKNHSLFNDVYTINDDYMLVFNFPYHTIKEKFLLGKYSEFDKKYIGNGKVFPRDVVKSGVIGISELWRILTKDPTKRSELSKELDVDIDKNAELWDIPKQELEIYRYNEKKQSTTSIYVLTEKSI